MAYTWHALTLADAPRWAAFTRVVSDADDADEVYTAQDLAEELADPTIDPTLDTVAVDDADGTLVAVGQVMAPMLRPDGVVKANFFGAVHPGHRGRGLGGQLLDRLHERAGELAAARHPGRAVLRSTQVPTTVPGAHALLEAKGYRAVRYFHTLSRRLDGLDGLDGPADPRVQPYEAARDAEVHAAHCDAFSTHWGFAPPTGEQWRTWLSGSRTFRPQCSVVGVDAQGGIVGYVLSYQYQPDELLIGQVGVRPAARGQGLARAMLQRVLTMAAPGYAVAKLDVDSENADGAGRLYESMGFARQRSAVVYQS